MRLQPIHKLLPLIAVTGILGATGTNEPQQQTAFTKGANGYWNMDWLGVEGRTYFVQWSTDLAVWHYAPMVEFGTGNLSYGINAQNAPGFFVRLRYVDDTTTTTLQQAKDADFDNDGIPNYYEVHDLFTDPLDKDSAGGDSDNDGLPDGWELYYFGSLGVADPNAALKPDGLTNKDKADLGLNPNTDYSATNAVQPASFTYDPAGRLTGVTAPVGTAGFTPDAEGNITGANP